MVHPISALQTEYSLWSREPEGALLDTCRELGIAFVAYSPLGRGFLTGRFRTPDDLAPDDWRRSNPALPGRQLPAQSRPRGAGAGDRPRRKGCTPAQLALAWLLSRGEDVIPIPGSTRAERVEENLGALDVTLTDEEIHTLERHRARRGRRSLRRGRDAGGESIVPVPLSVLDLVPIGSGTTAARAIRESVELAQIAERLGYVRYWFAEHHGMPGIASSAPEILIEHIASATATIRVGSGGIMLPNHAPLRIAETFHTLETIHPGRIDLGLGRAPGTDPVTSRAMRPFDAEQFPEQVQRAHRVVGRHASGRSSVPDRHGGPLGRVPAADLDPRIERRRRAIRRIARARLRVRTAFQPVAPRARNPGVPARASARPRPSPRRTSSSASR